MKHSLFFGIALANVATAAPYYGVDDSRSSLHSYTLTSSAPFAQPTGHCATHQTVTVYLDSKGSPIPASKLGAGAGVGDYSGTPAFPSHAKNGYQSGNVPGGASIYSGGSIHSGELESPPKPIPTEVVVSGKHGAGNSNHPWPTYHANPSSGPGGHDAQSAGLHQGRPGETSFPSNVPGGHGGPHTGPNGHPGSGGGSSADQGGSHGKPSGGLDVKPSGGPGFASLTIAPGNGSPVKPSGYPSSGESGFQPSKPSGGLNHPSGTHYSEPLDSSYPSGWSSGSHSDSSNPSYSGGNASPTSYQQPGGVYNSSITRTHSSTYPTGYANYSSPSNSTNSTMTSSSASSTATACAGNTASTRDQWCKYDINTDYYETVPDTNVTREYWLSLEQVEGAPDGVSRMLQTINGTVPGPTITANWGDWIIVHVTNNLPAGQNNGTTMHWHGLRQNYTNQMDGVSSVTQCPTAPGQTYTYKFRASQYGSSWYHSHFSLQAWEGMFGGIVIHGPASANYDHDLGNLFLQDWDHATADSLLATVESTFALAAATGLINGTNTYNNSGTITGSKFESSWLEGDSYLIRLVNVAIDTTFKFSIDNHTLTVIASDFVPIEPFTATSITISMGQRYDIIVKADQSAVANDFFLRAIPQTTCSNNDNANGITGYIHYGSSTDVPTTSPWAYVDGCLDETSLVPVVSKTVGDADVDLNEPASVILNAANYLTWALNDTSYLVKWADPTLLDVYNNQSSQTANTTNLISLPNKGEWVYIVISQQIPVAHPIHLHGHDFFVIGTGAGTFNASTANFTLNNPPRRDVAILQNSGWLALAFQTDNPGAWLMHCHIGWHTLEGFALQFLEMESEIHSRGLIDGDVLTDTCSSWNSYAAEHDPVQGPDGVNDSGI